MYNYRQMIDKAKEKGITSEAAMYAGIDDVDMMLAKLKETNPQMYWDFLRKQHKNLYKGHYDEDYARYDLSEIYYTTKNGDKIKGPYCYQVNELPDRNYNLGQVCCLQCI